MHFSGHASFVGKEVSACHETIGEWRSSSMYNNNKPSTRWCRPGGKGGGHALQAGMLLVSFPIMSLE